MNIGSYWWPGIVNEVEACWNGTYINSGWASNGSPQILYINAANADGDSVIQWDNGPVTDPPAALRPFVYNPTVAWGDTYDTDAKIRGILPDARIVGLPVPMDTTTTDEDGSTWLAYTNNFLKGTLWLLVNATPVTPASSPMAQYRKPLDLGTPPVLAEKVPHFASARIVASFRKTAVSRAKELALELIDLLMDAHLPNRAHSDAKDHHARCPVGVSL